MMNKILSKIKTGPNTYNAMQDYQTQTPVWHFQHHFGLVGFLYDKKINLKKYSNCCMRLVRMFVKCKIIVKIS